MINKRNKSMRLKTAKIILITIFTSTMLVANTLGLGDNGDGTWNVNYSSDGEISGFQFDVDGATINSASGGASGDAGFMVSSSATTALGFSLTGGTIPAGDGVLVVLELAGSPEGLSGIVVSDPTGADMGFTYDVGDSSDWDGDACSMPTNTIHLTTGGSVLFNSSSPIAGFQMDVDGTTIASASGGEAEAAGFMISAAGNTVLGFSLTGATFEGCGTMVELALDGEATGLSGIIISDSQGLALPFEYYDGSGGSEDILGCTDMDACNYNSDATVDDGSCEYAMENYDCDGNCTVGEDCAGECGGSAMEDECGECNGDGPEMCWDGSYECDVANCPDQPGASVEIMYDSDAPISGFQFSLSGVSVNSASGGAAEAAGFMLSNSETTVLGFSLTGEAIPAGSGVLVVLEVDGDTGAACVENVILSDADGVAMDVNVEGCVNIVVGGGGEDPYCGDGECNGDEDAESCPEDCESGGGDWDGDACSMPTNTVHLTSAGSIYFNTDTPVAGFQMDIDGDATILSASGGESEAAGFMVSSGANTVLGFSLTGATIDGCGTLVELEIDGDATGLSGIIISDSNGEAIPFEYFDGSGGGGGEDPYCGDGECNGDEDNASCPEDCEAPADCETDVCLSYSNFDESAGTVDIHMVNTVDVAGFQIELEGSTISSAAGGFAEAAGFMISNSESMVLGFSVTGDVLPPSTGNLITLTFASYNGYACFSDNTTFSDANAGALNITLGGCLGDGPVEGCMDMDACNYNPEANIDDGSCDYGTTCWDGSVECDANDCPELPTVEVLYNTDAPIAGFQFIVSGATVVSASGGAAEDAGYMVSAGGGNNAVVGFSLEGATIEGSGVLTVLDVAGDPASVCVGSVIIADTEGEPLDSEVVDCLTISIGGGTVDPYCGDGECNGDETSDSCPEDCDSDDCVEAWDGDACSMDVNSIHVTSGGMVLYNTDTPIAGFQFDLDGANILSAAGGNSEAAGFMISASATTVLGFSLDGSTIDGCGTMIELELDGDASGLSGIIISDANGIEIPYSYFEGGGDGEPCCGDGECNGDETSDSCPEDCGDDECPEGYDECGICDGPGAEYVCWDGEIVCEASDCSNEPGTDPFNFNQSTMFAYYFVFSAYDCPGEYLVAGEDWIGVYNGDVCVGGSVWPGGPVDVPAYGDDGEAYSAGYLNSGDIPTFKIYDASEDTYYDAMPNENFAFEPYGVNNVLRMDAGLFQNIMLDEGANLVSFYVLPDDNSVEDMMEPLTGNISAVLSDGTAAQYLDGWGWIGSLTAFEYESGYWMIMSSADELHLEGCDSPMLSLVYDLEAGANLISYPDPGSADVSEAIPDDVESYFEAILTDGTAAMNTESGWVGSLSSFDGGSGYWVIVEGDLSFSYNSVDDGFGRVVYEETLPQGTEFEVLQSSQQAFYFVDQIELLDGAIENGDWLLSYNKNVLTGVRQWQGVVIDVPAMGEAYDQNGNIFEGTEGYFQIGDTPTFKLLKNITGELVQLEGDIDEWTDKGVFTISKLTEVQPTPDKFGLDSAYPNPFNPTTIISFGLPFDSEISIQVYNLQGRVVETLASGYMQAGNHSVTWNADNFSSGVYFVKMTTGNHISTQKLLLVK